jgi:hypothetical protein
MRRKRGHVRRMRGERHWLRVSPLTTSAETSDCANRRFLLYRTYTLTWFHHRRFANISEDQKASVLIPRKPQRPVDFLRKSTVICPDLVHFHVSWSALQGPWHWSGLNTHTHTHAHTHVCRYFDCLLVYRSCCYLSSSFGSLYLFCRSEGVINHFADFTALLGLWN